MTSFQLWTLFGTPVVGAALAWCLVGVHRLLPKPSIPAKAAMEDRRLATVILDR